MTVRGSLEHGCKFGVSLYELGMRSHRLELTNELAFERGFANDAEILAGENKVTIKQSYLGQVFESVERRPVNSQCLHYIVASSAVKAGMVIAVYDVIFQALIGKTIIAVSTYGVELKADIKELFGKLTCPGQSDGIITCHMTVAQIWMLVCCAVHAFVVVVQQLYLHMRQRAHISVSALQVKHWHCEANRNDNSLTYNAYPRKLVLPLCRDRMTT